MGMGVDLDGITLRVEWTNETTTSSKLRIWYFFWCFATSTTFHSADRSFEDIRPYGGGLHCERILLDFDEGSHISRPSYLCPKSVYLVDQMIANCPNLIEPVVISKLIVSYVRRSSLMEFKMLI